MDLTGKHQISLKVKINRKTGQRIFPDVIQLCYRGSYKISKGVGMEFGQRDYRE